MTTQPWESWSQSSSGSGASFTEALPWPETIAYAQDVISSSYGLSTISEDANLVEELDPEEFAMLGGDALAAELPPGAVMSPKIPPAFNGRGSWFAYEELVHDWEDITTLPPVARAPALKNRLCDEAAVYKAMLDRAR